MGEGEEAGQLAGQTYQEGRLYYLFLKPRPPAEGPTPVANPNQGDVPRPTPSPQKDKL